MTGTSPAVADRVRDLLARMTRREKVAQLSSFMPMKLDRAPAEIDAGSRQQLEHGIGQISSLGMFSTRMPSELAICANAIQRYLVEETRLGIPAIIHNEALNGLASRAFPVFPTGIGLAATWNPEGVRAMADLTRRQMRAVGMQQALSPVMDVARDARWGRVHETYGEDPYLVGAFSVAFTRGLQGADLKDGVVATAKHFIAYSASEAGQNMAETRILPRELRDVYARPFEAAISEAGLASVMNSYSTLDGLPVAASRELLTGLLREELGFEGVVVSDYNTHGFMLDRQQIAPTPAHVAALTLSAGLDVDLPAGTGYGEQLIAALEQGLVSEEELDRSVIRVLTQKFELGLFDNPYVAEDAPILLDMVKPGEALAQELAEQSVTLLTNDGVLPLKSGKLAVVGPFAQDLSINFPAYTFPMAVEMFAMLASSTMAGLEAAEAVGFDMSRVSEADLSPATLPDYYRNVMGARTLAEALGDNLSDCAVVSAPIARLREISGEEMEAALAAARESDIVILAVGGRSTWLGGDNSEGEGSDGAFVELPEAQQRLIAAVLDLGKPVVAVVHGGRSYALGDLATRANAVLWAYFGGMRGSQAIAGVISGKVNPSGRLPFSIPRSVGQVPIYASQHVGTGYRRPKSDAWQAYIDSPATPAFCFGHGLSYTTVDYGELSVSATSIGADGTLSAKVRVTNSGQSDCVEVVQLYGALRTCGLTHPGQQLVGFDRVPLKAGEAKDVSFTIPLSLLSYAGMDYRPILEPGSLQLRVGHSSDEIDSTVDVEIVGPAVRYHKGRAHFSTVQQLLPVES